MVFGVRLPRALSSDFIRQALPASDGSPGLSAAMKGLVSARAALLVAIVAIDGDIRRMVRASDACRRLMGIPGVAFTAAVDDPERFRRSRDIGAYLGLVPRRYQSGEVDYTGSISKCGDRRVRTLLYEAANVILTRYKGPLKLKDWAVAVARRSTIARRDRAWPAPGDHHACHAALYTGQEAKPLIDTIEPVRITEEPLASKGNAFCTVNSTPRTSVLNVLSNCSSVISPSVPNSQTPAFTPGHRYTRLAP